MDGLVAVGLAVGNIINETPRRRFPKLMDIAQHVLDIAMGAFKNAANSNRIIDLIKTLLLVLHFAVDGINMLGTAVNALCRLRSPA